MTEESKPGFREPREIKKTRGVKLSNENSKFTKITEQKEKFEGLADEFIDKKQIRNKKAIELCTQFVAFVRDKTITENKTVMVKDIEKQIINDIVKLSLEINNDESEAEGMGSVAIINLLLKTTLLQREIINGLEYRLIKLEKSSTTKETPKL